MLLVTEAAGEHLAQTLKDAPENFSARLACAGQEVTLHQDRKRPGDTTFQHEGRTVLLLDAQASEVLAESMLDFKGAKLTLQDSR